MRTPSPPQPSRQASRPRGHRRKIQHEPTYRHRHRPQGKTKQAESTDAPSLTPRPTVSKNGEETSETTGDEMGRDDGKTSRKQAGRSESVRQRIQHEPAIGITSSGIEYEMTIEREPPSAYHRHTRHSSQLVAHNRKARHHMMRIEKPPSAYHRREKK